MFQGIAGIVFRLMLLLGGLGKARVSKTSEGNAEFVRKYGVYFVIAGPLVALVGVAMLGAAL
jgi:hypothetical protein